MEATQPTTEELTSFIAEQQELFDLDPANNFEAGKSVLEFLILSDNLEGVLEFLPFFVSSHSVPGDILRTLNSQVFAKELTPSKIATLQQINFIAMTESYIPSNVEAFMEILEIAIKGEVITYKQAKEPIEEIIRFYGGDYLVGGIIFDRYAKIVSECSGIKENMIPRALQSIFKRRFAFLHKRYEDAYKKLSEENRDMNTMDIFKRVEDLGQLSTLFKDQLESLEEDDFDKSNKLLNALILSKADLSFTSFFFENVLDRYSDKITKDIWARFIEYLMRNTTDDKLKDFYLRRACRANPLHLSFSVDYMRLISKDQNRLEEVYQELNLRLFNLSKSNLYQVWVYYFRFMLGNIVRETDLANNGDVEEKAEPLKETVEYFETILENDSKNLSFIARRSISEIYFDLLEYLRMIGERSFLEYIEEKHEKNLKFNGSDPKSWINYIDFIARTSRFRNDYADKLSKVFHRALRFCAGKVNKIYEHYRRFYEIYIDTNLLRFDEEYIKIISGRKDFKELLLSMERRYEWQEKQFQSIEDTAKEIIGKRDALETANEDGVYDGTEKSRLTLFVSNLEIGSSKSDVLGLFMEHKEIASTIKDVRIINRKNDDVPCSLAYIDFSSKEECSAAKKVIHGMLVRGRKVYAEVSKPPEKDTNENTLLLKNLPFDLKEDSALKELRVKPTDVSDFRPKRGMAYIKFTSHKLMNDYKRKLSTLEINGRKVIVIKLGARRENHINNPNSHQNKRVKIPDTPITESAPQEQPSIEMNQEAAKERKNDDFRKMFGL